ncbi:uncharacterized protein DC041_0005604 [Schistosoma bovis]|uniref:Uncharacterized protein n=1 Tax=Schistosoma bovis TaxID=6184 RepID=A0A430QUJ4_SCHBO|nr:uncharacterized protein DC041_0005604 [Schistosoma bovis]
MIEWFTDWFEPNRYIKTMNHIKKYQYNNKVLLSFIIIFSLFICTALHFTSWNVDFTSYSLTTMKSMMIEWFTDWFEPNRYIKTMNHIKKYQYNNKVLLSFIIIFSLFICTALHFTSWNVDFTSYSLTTMKSMVSYMMINLLKSIFYHQNGRFRCDLKACCLSNFCDRFMNDCQTVMNNVSTTYTTVFHFLITSISSNSQLLNLMNTWKLHNMEYHFYNCSNYLVIVLDNDILLNIDIIELWNHFENFNEIQSIGIGLEQNAHFQDVMQKLESNWEGYGYNNGVLLFDLSKIRLTLWNELWIVITRNALDTQGYLTTGEQVI